MRRQRGAALLVILLIVGALGAYFAISALNSQSERDQQTAHTLAQAKEALIGFAVTYRDLHPNQVFGLLPCPGNGNGTAGATCLARDVTAAGRLPWNTLGLPALRDSSAECLWYAISGRAKDSPPTTTTTPPFSTFNWDTVGQLIIRDTSGTLIAGTTPHEQPLGIVLAPRQAIGPQTRPPGVVAECRGSLNTADYLEGVGVPDAAGNTTIVLSTADSVRNATNNDLGLWITSRDIFSRVMARPEFGTDIDNLMNDLSVYLNSLPAASLPPASAGNKGTDTLITNFLTTSPPAYALTTLRRNFLNNWRDNLLYARPAGATTVNGTICQAVLFFGGARQPTQSRATPAERLVAGNYLENTNATLFPNAGAYTGITIFDVANPASDIVRCITGAAATATQVSFANDFSAFTPIGSGVTANGATQSVDINDGPTASGGCFWYPMPIPLAGKTLRAFYDFQFMISDDHALTGRGSDRGYGFTFQMLNAGVGPPSSCGRESDMGILDGSSMLGMFSFIFETDIYQNGNDPAGNHSGIQLNGTLTHAISAATWPLCNGTVGGCLHSPANKFEELPQPSSHNERIEITTGCNATCSACNPVTHGGSNSYARLTAWVDCVGCNDVTTNLDRIAKPPTMQRCAPLDPSLNSFYFGFTGGFRNGAGVQGATIRNFRLQTD